MTTLTADTHVARRVLPLKKPASMREPCCFCGYIEEHGNLLLRCGKHWMCDDCLLAGEGFDHDCDNPKGKGDDD